MNKFNILMGQNNAGKSTIIGSLKILAEGIRRAKSKINDYSSFPKKKLSSCLKYFLNLSSKSYTS